MKTKFKFTKEVMIKSVIIGVMLMMLILSFFFCSEIETFFGMRYKFRENEVSDSKIEKSDFKVTYIDVGQGHASLIEFPDGKTALIDGGDKFYSTKIENILKEKSISKIDYMIATHADSDHIGSFAYILEKFEVQNIYRPFQIAGSGSTFETFEVYADEDLKGVYEHLVALNGRNSKISRVTSNDYKEFISAIYNEKYTENNQMKDSEVTVFYDGLYITGNGYSIEFFGPEKQDYQFRFSDFSNTKGYATVGYGAGNSNGNSAICLVTILSETFLFTGDAAWSGGKTSGDGYAEYDFVASLKVSEFNKFENVSVYLAGHHGAKTSSGSHLLNLINPSFVVVSVGEKNSYGHPSKEMISRVEETKNLEKDYLLRTDMVGTIEFGLVNEKLVYLLEIYETESESFISWYLLGTIIVTSISLLVIFVKIKPAKK